MGGYNKSRPAPWYVNVLAYIAILLMNSAERRHRRNLKKELLRKRAEREKRK